MGPLHALVGCTRASRTIPELDSGWRWLGPSRAARDARGSCQGPDRVEPYAISIMELLAQYEVHEGKDMSAILFSLHSEFAAPTCDEQNSGGG